MAALATIINKYEIRKGELGNGLFARVDIRKGEEILSDNPIVCALSPGEFTTCVWSIVDKVFTKRVKFDRSQFHITLLPHTWVKEDEVDLQKIMKRHKKSKDEVLHLYWLIVTNNLTLPFIKTKNRQNFMNQGNGLYPILSFVNHSCDPNAAPSIQHEQKKFLVAMKDIQAGEEITFSYKAFSPALTRSDRDMFLFSSFGFHCKCLKCLSEKKE